MSNGFDINDDGQYKALVIQQLSTLMERTEGLPKLKEEHAVMQDQVAVIQDDMKDARKWENIKLFVIIPLVTALHAIARKFGANI